MAKPRQKRMPSLKRRTKTMITVLVEGNKTEFNILPGMFDKPELFMSKYPQPKS